MTTVCRWLKGRARREASGGTAGEPNPGLRAEAATERRLIVSVGPVQGFIAEARRTRDVWAGSFLLSWLSAIAMREIAKVVGADSFRFPKLAKDPLYQALIDGSRGESYQASLPNHCEARIPAGVVFDPEACGRAIQAKWRELAEAVWSAFLAPALAGDDASRARTIWKRQIGTTDDQRPFWEVQWLLLPATDGAEDWLERRKLWRTWPAAEPEPADLCTMMGDWQELSGHSRATGAGKEAQRDFWRTVQEHLKAVLKGRQALLIELRPNERLCAIALVKRLFPLLPPGTLHSIIGWPAPCQLLHRIDDSYRPSTAYLAAGHWLPRAWRHGGKECTRFTRAVRAAANARPLARAERISRLGLIDRHPAFAWLDGKLFFEGSYEAETELRQLAADDKKTLLASLAAIAGAKIPAVTSGAGEETVGRPSPYYAVLRMDGDQTGKLLSEHPARGALADALADFAASVRATVSGRHGELVFAGGDDLLALFPLEDALEAALELRRAWIDRVAERISGATISAGLVYVHYEVALRWALEESRRQLEKVAKEDNGRDSLAIAVLGRRGPAVGWATTWGSAAGQADLVGALDTLIADARGAASALSGNRFVYGVHERLDAFVAGPLVDRGTLLASREDDWPALDVAPAEVLLRAVGGEGAKDVSSDKWRHLVTLLLPHYRAEDGTYCARRTPLQFDLLLLLRFLATEWRRLDA